MNNIGSVHGRADYHYAVYALAAGAPFQFFSSCEATGCRDHIEWAPPMTLNYWYLPPENQHDKGSGLHLRWTIRDIFEGCAGFALMANESQPPSSLSDGIELFRWTPPDVSAEGEHERVGQLRSRPSARLGGVFLQSHGIRARPAACDIDCPSQYVRCN